MYRIGQGYDIHRLEEGHKLKLAGVEVESPFGAVAHSDGDVVYHAIINSIYGALGLSDIGEHYPDTDNKYKDIDSSILVKDCVSIMKNKGYAINNIDISIILEKPKLKIYKDKMKSNIATLLETDMESVSVKANTSEGVGIVGESKAICSLVSVLLKKI